MYPSKPMPITVEQIDQQLDAWQKRLRLAMDNLLALDDNLTYKRLQGKDGLQPIPLAGITKARVTPGLAAVQLLFQQIHRLNDIIDRATEMRKALPRFFPADKLREIDQLLNGESIQIARLETPLARRNLTSEAETAQYITPSVLLEQMAQEFDLARGAITTVENAWSQLEPALHECETRMVSVLKRGNALGIGEMPEILALRERVAGLRRRIETDPLGVSADLFNEIVPALERASASVTEAEGQRDRIQNDLAQARRLLEQLKGLHQQSVTALQQCQQQIADPTGLSAPLDPTALDELGAWLDTLDDAARNGRWKPARIGLDRWIKTAGEYAEAERTAFQTNQASIELRAELRGRLSALKAKAQARNLHTDTALYAFAQQAENLLHQVPTPLGLARKQVQEYETRLAQLQSRP